MNDRTNNPLFPSIVDDVLRHSDHCVDNIFAQAWKGLNLNRLIRQLGFTKRTGVSINSHIGHPQNIDKMQIVIKLKR